MSTPEARARLLFSKTGGVAQEETPEQRAARLFARPGMVPVEPEEEDRNDLLQAGAGVLEGILDPLSVIPFVDRRLQQLEEYRGSSTGGKIGYGIGAIGGFVLPYAPANLTLRAGTAAARGLKLVKSIDNNDDIVNLANKMTKLSLAGEFVQGAVSGGLMGAGTGEGLVETDSRMLDTLQGAAFGGIADVAISPIWRAISGVAKASKTQPKELTDFAKKALETSAKDNAPVVVDERAAELVGRALTLADNVLGSGADLEDKTELGLNLARALKSVEADELRVIPSVGKNHKEFMQALRDGGMDAVEATAPDGSASFLIGEVGSIGKELADEFSHYGFVKGQSAVVKGTKGTILGVGEKPGTVKMLFPGKKTKDVAREDMFFLPTGYTKSIKKSIGKASSLWSEFDEGYDRAFSSNVLATEAEKLGIAVKELVNKPERLSFDGAFEKFAADKGISGAQKAALKDYFVRRQEESIATFAKEEIDILTALRRENKDAHPEGALVEMGALRGYKVVPIKYEGKRVYAIRDTENGQTIPIGSKKAAEAYLRNHQREPQNAFKGLASPVSDDLLNTGGVAGSLDEAGLEEQLSPEVVDEMGRSIMRASSFIPREGYLRGVEDVAAKAGQHFPVYSEVFDPVARATVAWRNGRAPYMNAATKIIGRSWNRNIRRDHYDEWVQYMEAPAAQKAKVAKELGLNSKEIKAANDTRKLLDEVWEKEGMTAELGMTADQYITDYWPRMREFSQEVVEGENFKQYLTRQAVDNKMAISEKQIDFFADLKRMGHLTEYQTDPMVVLSKYINGITYKRYAKETYDKAGETFKLLRDRYKDDEKLAPHLVATYDYLRLVQGQMPEQAGTMSKVFKAFGERTGLSKYIDEATMDKVTTTYLGLNYGAFLGFRVAKAFINFTQLGHVYMKDGAAYMGRGMRTAFTKEGRDEAVKEGAVILQAIRMPYEDQIMQRIQGVTKTSTNVFGRAADVGLEVAEIGGKLFNKADEVLRAVSYHSQKHRAIDAWNGYKKFDRNEAFEEAAGLTAMGETVTREYFKILRDAGNEAAAKWLGVRAANDTQWMYQTGAGPIAFSRGTMKLFGQYGTWPAWYINWAKRGFTVGTKKDRTMFALRGAAFSGALIATGYATGVNTVRWHGPTSIFYSGGPMFDKLKDATTIWGGVGRPEGPPLEARLALGKYGVKYDENSPLHYGVGKPGNLARNTVGLVAPGALAAQDVGQAAEAFQGGGSLYRSIMIGLGFDMDDVDND